MSDLSRRDIAALRIQWFHALKGWTDFKDGKWQRLSAPELCAFIDNEMLPWSLSDVPGIEPAQEGAA